MLTRIFVVSTSTFGGATEDEPVDDGGAGTEGIGFEDVPELTEPEIARLETADEGVEGTDSGVETMGASDAEESDETGEEDFFAEEDGSVLSRHPKTVMLINNKSAVKAKALR